MRRNGSRAPPERPFGPEAMTAGRDPAAANRVAAIGGGVKALDGTAGMAAAATEPSPLPARRAGECGSRSS